MSAFSNSKSANADIKYDISDSQAATGNAGVGARIRQRSAEIGLKAADLCRLADIKPQTMSGYWNGERPVPADKLFAIADALKCSARWLVSGVRDGVGLSNIVDADWVDVPEYDLRELSDETRGPILSTTPMRKDWLNRSFGRDRGLWLTRLPSDYQPALLNEGDMVICCDMAKEELRERQLCIWRAPLLNQLLIARYSVIHRGNHIAVVEDGEYWANPWLIEGEINDGSGADLIVVGRILGRPLASIR